MPLTLCVQRSHRSPGGSGGHSPGGGGAPTEGAEKEDEVTSTTSTESVVSSTLSAVCWPVWCMPALCLHGACTVPALCLCSAAPTQYCTCTVPACVPMSTQCLHWAYIWNGREQHSMQNGQPCLLPGRLCLHLEWKGTALNAKWPASSASV